MTMTMEEMYEDLKKRGHLTEGVREERGERASLWPWAVTSLNTTLIDAKSEKAPQQNADLDRNSQ